MERDKEELALSHRCPPCTTPAAGSLLKPLNSTSLPLRDWSWMHGCRPLWAFSDFSLFYKLWMWLLAWHQLYHLTFLCPIAKSIFAGNMHLYDCRILDLFGESCALGSGEGEGAMYTQLKMTLAQSLFNTSSKLYYKASVNKKALSFWAVRVFYKWNLQASNTPINFPCLQLLSLHS